MDCYEDATTKFFNELAVMRDEFKVLTEWKQTRTKSSWICKDGHKVKICSMTDVHLHNTIKLLERKCPNSKALRYMRIENKYRTTYNTLKTQISNYEKIADMIF